MKSKSNIFLKRLALMLGVTSELSAQEKLDSFIKDQQHINLLERIKVIRQGGYYEPDYNKPKLYTDVQILIGEGCPISDGAKLAHDRPIDFGGDIRAWKKSIRIDYKREMKEKKVKEEILENLQNAIEHRFAPFIMSKMMRLD